MLSLKLRKRIDLLSGHVMSLDCDVLGDVVVEFAPNSVKASNRRDYLTPLLLSSCPGRSEVFF